MTLCAQRGVQQLTLEPETEDLPATFTQDGLLKFCFEGADCAMRSLRISGVAVGVIDASFIPLFIEVNVHVRLKVAIFALGLQAVFAQRPTVFPSLTCGRKGRSCTTSFAATQRRQPLDCLRLAHGEPPWQRLPANPSSCRCGFSECLHMRPFRIVATTLYAF